MLKVCRNEVEVVLRLGLAEETSSRVFAWRMFSKRSDSLSRSIARNAPSLPRGTQEGNHGIHDHRAGGRVDLLSPADLRKCLAAKFRDIHDI